MESGTAIWAKVLFSGHHHLMGDVDTSFGPTLTFGKFQSPQCLYVKLGVWGPEFPSESSH